MSGKIIKAPRRGKTALTGVCIALLLGLTLAACGPRGVGILPPVKSDSGGGQGQSSGQPGAQPSFSQYPDIPLPGGAEFNMENTMTVGSDENWYGRLMLNASFGPFDMFDFFKQKMAEFGWREITSVRGPVSVLTYTRQNRVATIQIQGQRMGGSTTTITVSPQRGEAPPFATAPRGLPPGPASIQPTVRQVQ